MKVKISATFEGTCTICGKDKVVFTAGDEDTKKIVTICKECTSDVGDVPTSDVIEKYGKVNESVFGSDGISIKSMDKIQEDLKNRIKEDENE